MNKPRMEGWFVDDPDPALTIQMLVLQRGIADMHGPWHVAGALICQPDGAPQWVHRDEVWFEDAVADDVWQYTIQGGGDNGYTSNVAFVRIESVDDAASVVSWFNANLAEGHPLGLKPTPAAQSQELDHPTPAVSNDLASAISEGNTYGALRVRRGTVPLWNEAPGPWSYGTTAMCRVLANPTGNESLPASPYPRSEHEQAISYWSALYYMLKYSLGWMNPGKGMMWWLDHGVRSGDRRLEVLDRVWHEDGYLDIFAAWLCTAPSGSEAVRPDPAWLRRQELRAQALTWPPFTGGSDPLHLQNVDAEVNGAEPNEEARLLRSSTKERAAVLMLDRFQGWYGSLGRLGGTLPELGSRSWHIDVVVREVGWLGTYRRSRETGLWFSGQHRFHVVGN